MSITNPFFYLQDSLNDDGSVTDRSANARPITMSGVTEGRDADFGSCFTLFGGAYFEAACPCPASFTMALWVRRLYEEEGQTRSLIELGTGDVRLCLNDMRPSFNDRVVAGDRLSRDLWQHLAVSYDAETQQCVLYVDGARVAAAEGAVQAGAGDLRIGRGHGEDRPGFEGNMAHVVLYDRALPDDEIQQIMWLTEKTLKPVLLLRDTTRLAEGLVPDDSGHGGECTAEGVTAVTDDERGPCFQLSKGYLQRDAQLCPGAFTLSAWVKQDSAALGGFYPLIELGQDAPRLGIQGKKLALTGGAADSANFPSGVWKHVAVTYNPITARSVLYVDGAEVGAATGPIDTNGAGLLVGTGSRDADPLFPGLMTHVAVHDTPLSRNDIQLLRDYSALRPRLHLPLKSMDVTGRTPDLSGHGADAMCNGAVAVSDSTFGAAFSFDGIDDNIDLPTLTCPASFTFAAYIQPDERACARDVSLMEFGRGEPNFDLAYGRLKVHLGPIADADRALNAGLWYHVAATYDAAAGQVRLYINGELVRSGDFTGSLTGLGLGVGHRYSAGWFSGRMRHVMIYGAALTKDVIRQIIVNTSPPAAKSAPPLTRPGVGLFTMDLVNDDDQPVVYLDGGQELSLSVENTWGGDIQLITTDSPVGPECFHLQVQFRQGTLSAGFRDELIAGAGAAVNALRALGWALRCEDLGTGGDLISLLWMGAQPGGQATTPPGGLIKSRSRLLLPLRGLQVKVGAGSRTTRVLMRYNQMRLPDGTAVPKGQRIELLNILSAPKAVAGTIEGVVAGLLKDQITASARLPVEIKLAGASSLLNDGGPNTIEITIKNTRRHDEAPARLDLGADAALDAAPKLYLTMADLFDDIEGSTPDSITGVQATIASSSTSPTHVWTCSRDGARWRVEPPAGEKFFEPGETLTVTLKNLRTSERDGTIYLTVRYEDILAFGEGEFHVPVRVAPLSFSRIADRDTVVIRHGDQAGVEPTNEALFVESSEGRAARFVGGGGVAIDSPDAVSNALWVRTRELSTNTAVFVEKTGSMHGVHVSAVSSDAAVHVEQLGKGQGIGVYKKDSNDPNEVGSPAIFVRQNGKAAAVRVDKLGAAHGLLVNATSAEAAVRVEQNGKGDGLYVNKSDAGDGLRVNKNGPGRAAEFTGGDGVYIDSPTDGKHALEVTTKASSTVAGIHVDQRGSGPAAELIGGGGLKIEDPRPASSGLSVKTTANSSAPAVVINKQGSASGIDVNAQTPDPAVEVTQTGSGRSASFTGGEGVHTDKLTAGTIECTTRVHAAGALQVDGNLTAGSGGLTVQRGAPLQGVSAVELRSVNFSDSLIEDKFWSGSRTVYFSQSVRSALVFLQGFDIWFSDKAGTPGETSDGDDVYDRPFHRMKIDPSWSVSGSSVTVSIRVGLRDESGEADDKYGFDVTVGVIAVLEYAA